MSKSESTYWNVLKAENISKWSPIEGTDGMLEEITLSIETFAQYGDKRKMR